MIEAFFQYLKAPFGLFRFNLYDLQTCDVCDWMSREISEIPNPVDCHPKGNRDCLSRVRLRQEHVYLPSKILCTVTMGTEHGL